MSGVSGSIVICISPLTSLMMDQVAKYKVVGTGETAHIGKKDVVGPAHPDAVTGQAQENKRKNNDIVMNV